METSGRVTADLLSTLEALLYAADDPVPARRIVEVIEQDAQEGARACDVTVELVHSASLELEERLRERDSALQVVEVAGGYRLGTRPRFDALIRVLRNADRPTRLSVPLLETLAIVAYRQPVTTAEVSAIRGKDPGAALRRLRDLGLVRVAGRRRTVGRPFTFGTTDDFLELFGLRDLEELPAPEEFHELLES